MCSSIALCSTDERSSPLSPKPRIAYFVHSLRSDWNNGNAHFLRGLLRDLQTLGHPVIIYEREDDWSITHLREEPAGGASLRDFNELYPELHIETYTTLDAMAWEQRLRGTDIVILHEWNPPALGELLLSLRGRLHYRLLFHDTHHRALSAPDQLRAFGLEHFDGALLFGEVLRALYAREFQLERTWVLHEAADTALFKPHPAEKTEDVVWIGNWGDEERSEEIRALLLGPAAQMPERRFRIFGVRYPPAALDALAQAGVAYGGYLPNLHAPAVYDASRLTVHIPRRYYAEHMPGIPTIRVFEALACGIPLLSAPWQDDETLFRAGDFLVVRNGAEMRDAMHALLTEPAAAQAQAARGFETVLARHTCLHRAQQLSALIEEHLS